MVKRYGDEYARADNVPFDDGGCVNKDSNFLLSLSKEKMENDPSSKPKTTFSHSPSESDPSIAMDVGSWGAFV